MGSYLIAPGVWQWNRAAARAQARTAITQIDVEPGPVDPQLVSGCGHHHQPQSAPIIITYHDIGYNKSKYTVTPQDFAMQMRMIHDAAGPP